MEGRFLRLMTDPPAGGALYVPNLENTPYINNFTIDVSVPTNAYMVPPTFNGTGTKPCPEPCPYPDIQNATSMDVMRWYASWFTRQSVHVPWGYYVTGYDRWCNNEHYLRMHYGDMNEEMGAPHILGTFRNQTFVKDWFHFYVGNPLEGNNDNRSMHHGLTEMDFSHNYSAIGPMDGPQYGMTGELIHQMWPFMFLSGFQPTDWYMSSDPREFQPGYTAPWWRGFGYFKKNESLWNSIENPRCMLNQAIHYGPKLFCLQAGSGNQYTDTTVLCNLRRVDLLGPGRLRLHFYDKKPTFFRDESLSEYTTYYDTWYEWNMMHRDAAQKTYVNFSASTWYDNSTGFDQRRDYHQENIVALFPGGDGHNWARNNYTGIPGNRDTWGQILAAPKRLWNRSNPPWTFVNAVWFRVNDRPIVAVRPAWSYACKMRLDTNYREYQTHPGDGRCILPPPVNTWRGYPPPYYANVDRWAPFGCTKEVFWYNKTQFVMPPDPYQPGKAVYDFTPVINHPDDDPYDNHENEWKAVTRKNEDDPNETPFSYYPSIKELRWQEVFRGAGAQFTYDYRTPHYKITAKINGSTIHRRTGYYRHMLRWWRLNLEEPMAAYPVRKVNRTYHAHEMYDVRSMPMCAPRQPNNKGGQELGKIGTWLNGNNNSYHASGDFDDFRVFSKYMTLIDCRNTRGELYTEEMENEEHVREMMSSGEVQRNNSLVRRYVFKPSLNFNSEQKYNWVRADNDYNLDRVIQDLDYWVFQGPNYRLVWDAHSDYAIPNRMHFPRWHPDDIFSPEAEVKNYTGAFYRQYGGVVKMNETHGDLNWNFKEDISCAWFSKRETSDDFSFPGKRHYLQYDRSQGYDVYELDTDYPADALDDPKDPEHRKLHRGRNDTQLSRGEITKLATQYNIPRQERFGAFFSYNTTWACNNPQSTNQHWSFYGGRYAHAKANSSMWVNTNGTLHIAPGPWQAQHAKLANDVVITHSFEKNIPVQGNLNDTEMRGAADVCPKPIKMSNNKQSDRTYIETGAARYTDSGFRWRITWKMLDSRWSHLPYDPREWLILSKVIGTRGEMYSADDPALFIHKSRAHEKCGGLYLNDLMHTSCDQEKDGCLEGLPAYLRRKEGRIGFGTFDSGIYGARENKLVSPHLYIQQARAYVRTNIYNRLKCPPLGANIFTTNLRYRRYGRFSHIGVRHYVAAYTTIDHYFDNDWNVWETSTLDAHPEEYVFSDFLQVFDGQYRPYWGIRWDSPYPYWNTTELPEDQYLPTWMNDTYLLKDENSNGTMGAGPEVLSDLTNVTVYDNWRHENSYMSFMRGCLVCRRRVDYGPESKYHNWSEPMFVEGVPHSRMFHMDFYFTDHNNTNKPPRNWAEISNNAPWDDCVTRPFLEVSHKGFNIEWTVTIQMFNVTMSDVWTPNPLEPWV